MVKDVIPPLSADLIERIIDYVIADFPELAARAAELKESTRLEFAGTNVYISHRSAAARLAVAEQALHLFNGRNATEVARRLNISRAQVYRIIKRAGK